MGEYSPLQGGSDASTPKRRGATNVVNAEAVKRNGNALEKLNVKRRGR